jgi:hypothetical protein
VNYGVLGTGMVGRAIASKLAELGHEVMMGSRQAGNEKAVAWAEGAGALANQGSFADAAGFGEVLVIATAGEASIEALQAAGVENLAGKVLIDVGNALDHSQTPPAIMASTQGSLGERIQGAFPDSRVVKTLNTVNAEVMVEPSLVPGAHTMFVCGDDEAAKTEVSELLQSFGWPAEDVIDLGDISSARGMEMYVGLWLRVWQATGTLRFNIKLITGED